MPGKVSGVCSGEDHVCRVGRFTVNSNENQGECCCFVCLLFIFVCMIWLKKLYLLRLLLYSDFVVVPTSISFPTITFYIHTDFTFITSQSHLRSTGHRNRTLRHQNNCRKSRLRNPQHLSTNRQGITKSIRLIFLIIIQYLGNSRTTRILRPRRNRQKNRSGQRGN